MSVKEINNWNVSYSVISFFERVLNGHDKVVSFSRKKDIIFEIKLQNNRILTLLLVTEYILGLEAVLRAKSEFPEIDYVLTNANWNTYTSEAKDYGLENSIGIFNLSEFLTALHWDNPKLYQGKDKNGNHIYGHKSA